MTKGLFREVEVRSGRSWEVISKSVIWLSNLRLYWLLRNAVSTFQCMSEKSGLKKGLLCTVSTVFLQSELDSVIIKISTYLNF